MTASLHQPATSPDHGHGARSEEDRIRSGPVVVVGLAALLVFFLGSLAAVSYLRVRQAERGPIAIPVEVGRSKIGLVEQQTFDLAARGARQRARQLERLGSWGWVDRAAGVAHIPIDVAMRLVASGVRPGAGGGEPPPPGGQP
jgi:hypothetical protein